LAERVNEARFGRPLVVRSWGRRGALKAKEVPMRAAYRFHFSNRLRGTAFRFLTTFALLAVPTFPANGRNPACSDKQQSAEHLTIPAGTILPVILETTIAPSSAKQGQVIRAKIAQDVPLPGDAKIRKGSKVEGRVVEVVRVANGEGAKISVRFDKLYVHGQPMGITTNLRAIAGFMAVLDASTPNQAIGEGDVPEWMTTTQIGGDSVFGQGGVVTSAPTGEVVGESPMSGGVLVQPRPSEAGNCRGSVNGSNSAQALWVFSSDACGTYGLSKVSISHAGRTDPVGTITFDVQSHAKIRDGAGLLLRVIG